MRPRARLMEFDLNQRPLDVAEALLAQDISLYLGDRVTPSLGSRVLPDMRVYIERSLPVSIGADGQTLRTRTQRPTVGEALAQEGIALVGQDYSLPAPDTPLSAGLLEMSRKGLGMTTIVDDGRRVLGIFTDGDLRRALDRQLDVHSTPMRAVMTAGGKVARPRMLAAEAVHMMEEHRITALPVVDDENVLVGALNVHDLLRAGVM